MLSRSCMKITIGEELKFLATIFSFVIQNLTEYIHRTPCTFKNDSQLKVYRHLELSNKKAEPFLTLPRNWFDSYFLKSKTQSYR